MNQYIKQLKALSKKVTDEDWIGELPILQQFLVNVIIGAVLISIFLLFVYLLFKFWIVIAFIVVAGCAGLIARKLL